MLILSHEVTVLNPEMALVHVYLQEVLLGVGSRKKSQILEWLAWGFWAEGPHPCLSQVSSWTMPGQHSTAQRTKPSPLCCIFGVQVQPRCVTVFFFFFQIIFCIPASSFQETCTPNLTRKTVKLNSLSPLEEKSHLSVTKRISPVTSAP